MKKLVWKKYGNRKAFCMRIATAAIQAWRVINTYLDENRERYPDATASVDFEGLMDYYIAEYANDVGYCSQATWTSLKKQIFRELRVFLEVTTDEWDGLLEHAKQELIS